MTRCVICNKPLNKEEKLSSDIIFPCCQQCSYEDYSVFGHRKKVVLIRM
ncbi:MAG: hypothetical protein ACTSSI_16330 [Candidatus Helarchaeota archaeon]